MGATSNGVKQRWNKEHYALIKAYINLETAEAFRAKCQNDGISASGKVGDMITWYLSGGRMMRQSVSVKYDVKTRAMRRKAVAAAIEIIEAVHDAEVEYMENIPTNLQESQVHDAAEQTSEALYEALGILREAYQ